MSQKSILENISSPKDLKILSLDQLSILSDELRSELISSVSKTGGHLGAGLGVIELTIALHYIFNAPNDKIIWDVGHQAYPHKILTGRKEKMNSLRQENGLSGFTNIQNLFMMHLALDTHLHQFQLVWAWLLEEI